MHAGVTNTLETTTQRTRWLGMGKFPIFSPQGLYQSLRGTRGGDSDNDQGMQDHLEAQCPAEGASLWVASLGDD